MTRFSSKPKIGRWRVMLAFGVALVADGIQILLGPVGWGPFDEIVDVAAMVAIVPLLGFHPLLLPTFIIEIIPVADMLPTWTGCVAAVVFLRRRSPTNLSPPLKDISPPRHRPD